MRLKWSTASEQNSKDFLVKQSTDGKNWKVIGTVNAGGNSNRLREYSFDDTNPSNGINYYQLTQRDFDEKFTNSIVVSAIINSVSAKAKVYPNPSSGGIFNIELEKSCNITIFNTTGSVVYNSLLPIGVNQVNLSDLTKGIYFIKINEDNIRFIMQ